ncbi:MAG: formylmethanofuran--tetrahydromethanopterin N-formyltransferase [Planctomycetota bacterium]
MKIGPTIIEDTFAEAFSMRYTRLIVTAHDEFWLDAAVREFSGYGTSVIACDAEVGLEKQLDSDSTFDGRPGASIMAFGFSADALGRAVIQRTGQCLMTCATTAVFNGLFDTGDTIAAGKHLRYFGDGFQKSKLLGDRRFWRIPVMDGEFIIEEKFGVAKGVAGGNLMIQTIDQSTGLDAARRAVKAISVLENVITPFPGGVVRSGSKVGSRYKGLIASTSHTFCPTLKGRVESKVHDGATCVYEIVIDGSDFDSVAAAMKAGISAAAGQGVVCISAGNYGGKLGKHHFHLRELLT